MLEEASVSLAMALIGTGACLAVAALVATGAALLCRRFWQVDRWMAVPCGLAGLVVASMAAFFAWLGGPTLGRVVGDTTVLASLVICARHVWSLPAGRRLESVATAVRRVAPVALATGAVLLVTMGLTYLWTSRADLFSLSAIRFSHQLPWDNELQAIISNRLADGLDPRGQLSSWLTSDRPPLQSGFQLLTMQVGDWLPLERPALLAHASVAAQLVWVPAAYAVCRSLGHAPRSAVLAAVFAGFSGTVLLNTVFTWPKIMCAGLLLAAVAVALRYRTRPRTGEAVVLALLTAGGALAHGSGVFFVPVLIAVLLWGRLRTARPAYLLTGIGTAVLTYAPWLAYQRFYDPPGTRLLFYQLAGVKEIVREPFLPFLLRRYADAGWSEVLHDKMANLAWPVRSGPFDGFSLTGLDFHARRVSEFFVLSTAVGWAALPLLGLVCAAVVTAARHRQNPAQVRTAVRLLAVSLLGMILWALALWGPGTTWLHVSPLAPLFLVYLLPTAWVAGRRPVLGWALLLLQVALLLLTYAPGRDGDSAPLSMGAVVAVVLGLSVVVLAIATAPDSEMRDEDRLELSESEDDWPDAPEADDVEYLIAARPRFPVPRPSEETRRIPVRSGRPG
jgi:hypothetical protein